MATTKFATKKTSSSKKGKGSGLPTLKYPGDVGYDKISGVDISVDDVDPTDTAFNYDPITSQNISAQDVAAGKITAGSVSAGTLADRFMTAADYTMVDPSEIASEYGDIYRQQATKNTENSTENALKILSAELQGLQSFAPAAAALQRGEVAKDNQFNQSQKDAQLAATDPNIRADLMSQRDNANALASGRLPSSIDDRALELGIRSSAADAAAGGGFGVKSSAARKASALMSADKRLGILMQGEQLRSSNIDQRSKTLLADLQQATGGSQISVNPSQTAGQVALSLAQQANQGSITAKDALSNLTQQEQFKTGIQQETNTTNVNLAASKDLNQARLNLEADTTNLNADMQAQTTNVGNELQANLANQSAQLTASQTNESNRMRAAEVNASNAIQVQTTQKQLQSNEKQFNATMSYNVRNANAERTFQASNTNAGRALEVATSNRAMKFQVQQTNKQMIFQDQQARAAEAAANARAAMSARASSANAALSYKSQQEALAAQKEMQAAQLQFQLGQQAQSQQNFQAGLSAQQSSANWATAGGIIARAPSIIQAGQTLWNGAATLWGSDTGTTTTFNSGSDGVYNSGSNEVSPAGQDTSIFF